MSRSEAQRRKMTDPERRKRLSEAMKKSLKDPEKRRRMSEAARERWKDPGYRAKRAARLKAKHAQHVMPERTQSEQKRLETRQRNRARKAVECAGLMLLARFVDRGVELLEAGHCFETCVDALHIEFHEIGRKRNVATV